MNSRTLRMQNARKRVNVNTDSKSVMDVLRDAGFHRCRRSDNWLSRDLRKEFSHEVVREYEKHPGGLRSLIEEPVPTGQFYFYRLRRASRADRSYQKILIRLDLAQLLSFA